MKRLLFSLLMTGYAGQATAATCAQPVEARAFAAITLKSELMVGALSCGRDQQYDRFMSLFLPYIQAQQQVMDNYFERGFGLAGQMAEDEYTTALANEVSEASLAPGARYCSETSSLFLQVLTLDDANALTTYIAANPPKQLDTAPLCPGALTAPFALPAEETEAMNTGLMPVEAEPLAPPPGVAAPGVAVPGVAVPYHARLTRVHHARPSVIAHRKAPRDGQVVLTQI